MEPLFKIYLPLVDAAPPEVENRIFSPSARCTETILAVEDEDGVCGMADRILREAGYVVIPATNGADAIHLIEQNDGLIHMLLTDVVMPDMAGQELTDRVLDFGPKTKIL